LECFQESKLKPKSLNWQIGYRLCKRLFIAALPQAWHRFGGLPQQCFPFRENAVAEGSGAFW
jgi:hypothetical protein